MNRFLHLPQGVVLSAALVLIGGVACLPSAYDYFVVEPTFPSLPGRFIASQMKGLEAGRFDLMLPVAGPGPVGASSRAPGQVSRTTLAKSKFDDVLSAAMMNAGRARTSDALAQLQVQLYEGGDYGFAGLLSWSDSAGGSFAYMRAVNGFSGGMGGISGGGSRGGAQSAGLGGGSGLGFSDGGTSVGGALPTPHGCDTCDSVYGGPRLPYVSDIPLPTGSTAPQPPQVEFTPSPTVDGGVGIEPVLTSDPDGPSIIEVPKGPKLTFDPGPRNPDDPAPVPEPATLILTGLGLSGLVARNRMRKRA